MAASFSSAPSPSPAIQLLHHPHRRSSLPPPPPRHLLPQDAESFVDTDAYLLRRESFLGSDPVLHREILHESGSFRGRESFQGRERLSEKESFHGRESFGEKESFLGRESFSAKESFLSSKDMPLAADDNQRSFSYSNHHHRLHHNQYHPQQHQHQHPSQYQYQHLNYGRSHYRQSHTPSGSPNFLKPAEINRSSCQGGVSDLHFSPSSPYFAEESIRKIPSRRRSEPSYCKFQFSEGSTPAYNASDNAYVPRTPQIEDFAVPSSSTLQCKSASSANLFPPSCNYPRNADRQDIGMASTFKGSDHCMPSSQKQIKLYRWYLIKCGASSSEIAVGGLLGAGTADNRRQETTAITKRIHKCRLLTKDGHEVCLTGLIDDCTTISNGFSMEIVQLFLSGFPYTWNHILQNEIPTCSFKDPVCLLPRTGANQQECIPLSNGNGEVTYIPDAKKDFNAYQEKHTEPSLDESLRQGAFDALDEQDYGIHAVLSTPTEELHGTMQSSIKVVNKSDESMLPKCHTSEEGNKILVVSSDDRKLQTLDGPVGSKVAVRNSRKNREKSNRIPQLPKRVTRSMQRACRDTDGNENRSMNGTTDFARSDVDSSENTGKTDVEIEDMDTGLATATDMLVKDATWKDLNVSHANVTDMPLKEKTRSRRKSVGNNVNIQAEHSINIKSLPNHEREGKIQPSNGEEISLSVEVIDLPNLQESGAESQSCKEGTETEGNLSSGLDSNKSSQETGIESQLYEDKETGMNPTRKAMTQTISVVRTLRSSKADIGSLSHGDKDASCRLGMVPPIIGSSQSTSGAKRLSSHEVELIIEETETECQSHENEEMRASDRSIPCTKRNKQSSTAKANALKDEQIGTGSLSRDDKEIHASRREEGIPLMKGKKQSSSAAEKFRGAEAEQMNSLEHEESGIEKKMHISWREGMVAVMEGNIQSKTGDSQLSSSEIIDLADSLQVIETQNQVCKKDSATPFRSGMIPPPLPYPRVSVSKQLISAAFGLKTSRSGRLLVPPLAHWCSQSLLRDKDGGIIAISNGSMNMGASETGFSKFKPPAEVGLQNLQKRLRKAAEEGRNKKTANKKKKES